MLDHTMSPRRWLATLALILGVVISACSGQTGSGSAAPDPPDADLAEPDGLTESSDIESADIEGAEREEPEVQSIPQGEQPESDSPPVSPPPTVPLTAAEATVALGRGINFGNSLEAPREGDWGAGLDAEYFEVVAEAGFDHIRLPISWADYASLEAPFTIPDGVDPTVVHPDYDNIWERVDWAIEQSLANDLRIIVNMHHYDAAHEDPEGERARLVGMWEQIAARYADQPAEVYFELFNEPQRQFTERPELWNDIAAELLEVVRRENPTRNVLVGPVGFNSIDELDVLVLPDDPHLITTVHLYEPFPFTHQGADWIDPVPPRGVLWSPGDIGLIDGVVDSSWDLRSTTEDGQLRVDYERQWAGFGLTFDEAVQPTSATFEVRGNTALLVGCRLPDDDLLNITEISVGNELQTFTADLSSCPSETVGITVMNATTNLDPVRFERIEVCSQARSCESMFDSAENSLRRWVQRAAEWSDETGFPIHIGEFGAIALGGSVPVEDRAAWTATIVDEAEANGIPFSYWEFHSEFAAFDLNADAWVADIRDALTG